MDLKHQQMGRMGRPSLSLVVAVSVALIELSWACGLVSGQSLSDQPAAATPTPPDWLESYPAARDLAKSRGAMLLICFHDHANRAAFDRLRAEMQVDSEITRRLTTGWVLVSLPLESKVRDGDKDVVLLEHAAFAEMLGRPGLAILDYRDATAPYYGRVVSVFPLGKEGAKYRPAALKTTDRDAWIVPRDELLVLLDLPAGSLTQRTLIFAVRTHSERPASASGELLPVLAEESESHAAHQADIRVQGHHAWERRFHRINARLPDGLLAAEVVAESWPGQTLVEAARECVHSWRQSSGHWDTVRGGHRVYGYDMKRGSNGIWYATGIFGRR